MKLLDIVKYRLNLPLNKELENRPKKVSLFKKVSMATLRTLCFYITDGEREKMSFFYKNKSINISESK